MIKNNILNRKSNIIDFVFMIKTRIINTSLFWLSECKNKLKLQHHNCVFVKMTFILPCVLLRQPLLWLYEAI